MDKIEIEPWEPEETIGKLWHALAGRIDAPPEHPGAAVDLSEVDGRLAVFFRGLGGGCTVEIRAAAAETSRHRLSWRRKLGAAHETLPRASFDGEVLRLPQRLAVFALREANAALYLWLTACAAHASYLSEEDDALRADLAAILAVRQMEVEVLRACPGLRSLRDGLAEAALLLRGQADLPKRERAVEALIRAQLGDPAPLTAWAADWQSCLDRDVLPETAPVPHSYRPFRPVPLWLGLLPVHVSATATNETADGDSEGPSEEAGETTHRARRKQADQAARGDSLILHKFEAILSWSEFLNLNRRVDDDDNDDAKKAAEDQDEIGLGQVEQAPATRLKLHLDLAPEDVDRERLSAKLRYPEWDCRSGAYLADHCRVLESWADPLPPDKRPPPDPASARRIRAVRRQFEALRPGRVILPGQPDGEELDMEAAVRAQAELVACGTANDRVWRQARPVARDLAVSILLDISRSTESAVEGRSVIDVEREALTALAWGLDACGDDFAISAFSSLRRDRVFLTRCKAFGSAMDQATEDRIAALRPGFYTRMGAAIRHASADLMAQARRRRLLLVITDGKPNDLDHYEGRHGIEDTAMAIREARRAGHAVFGVTVDAAAKAWFARMFGRGGFSVVPHPDRLTTALPEIYRQLVGA